MRFRKKNDDENVPEKQIAQILSGTKLQQNTTL